MSSESTLTHDRLAFANWAQITSPAAGATVQNCTLFGRRWRAAPVRISVDGHTHPPEPADHPFDA
jgi:hypothetical protein